MKIILTSLLTLTTIGFCDDAPSEPNREGSSYVQKKIEGRSSTAVAKVSTRGPVTSSNVKTSTRTTTAPVSRTLYRVNLRKPTATVTRTAGGNAGQSAPTQGGL